METKTVLVSLHKANKILKSLEDEIRTQEADFLYRLDYLKDIEKFGLIEVDYEGLCVLVTECVDEFTDSIEERAKQKTKDYQNLIAIVEDFYEIKCAILKKNCELGIFDLLAEKEKNTKILKGLKDRYAMTEKYPNYESITVDLMSQVLESRNINKKRIYSVFDKKSLKSSIDSTVAEIDALEDYLFKLNTEELSLTISPISLEKLGISMVKDVSVE